MSIIERRNWVELRRIRKKGKDRYIIYNAKTREQQKALHISEARYLFERMVRDAKATEAREG